MPAINRHASAAAGKFGDQMSTESQLASAALDTLHGARGLPPDEAVARLRDFLDSISSHVPNSARLADASGALNNLIQALEAE